MYSLKCIPLMKCLFFSKSASLNVIKKNKRTFHTHQIDNDFLRGRSANFTITPLKDRSYLVLTSSNLHLNLRPARKHSLKYLHELPGNSIRQQHGLLNLWPIIMQYVFFCSSLTCFDNPIHVRNMLTAVASYQQIARAI